jgi:hypothetical protein
VLLDSINDLTSGHVCGLCESGRSRPGGDRRNGDELTACQHPPTIHLHWQDQALTSL